MTRIDIQFTLFSAFYSPLIATMAGGFLAEEGLEGNWSVSPPGSSAIAALKDGTAHVVQSAPSQAFGPLSKGEDPGVVHFAQINETDGFFLTAREPDADFDWRTLEGAEVVLFGGGQPLAMFKYACHKAGIDYGRLKAIHPGNAIGDRPRLSRRQRTVRAAAGGRSPSSWRRTASAISWRRSAGRSALAAFPACAPGRTGWRPPWPAPLPAPTARPGLWLNETPAAEVARAEQSFFPGGGRGGAGALYRGLSAARLLDAAHRDHARGLRGDARHLRLQRPDRRALRLRAGLHIAAGGLTGFSPRSRPAPGTARAVPLTTASPCRNYVETVARLRKSCSRCRAIRSIDGRERHDFKRT